MDMKAKNILVHIDVTECPLELFSFINGAVKEEPTAVTLLHVSRLNVAAPENRLYVEVEQEIRSLLLRLKSEFINPGIDLTVCVRSGKPAREIVAQAAASESDLIVLTNHFGHRRKRLFGTDIVEQVVASAPCPVRVLRVNSRMDCHARWMPADAGFAPAETLPSFLTPKWPHLAPTYSMGPS